jgi:cation:H+ antiporter
LWTRGQVQYFDYAGGEKKTNGGDCYLYIPLEFNYQMSLLTSILFIGLGIFILMKGADYLIDGAADVARWMKVSPMLVGLTVVAFGTSLPEFMVSLLAVLGGQSDISMGTIIGSNIANIAIGIGVSAAVAGLVIKSKTLIYELPFLLISNFFLLILATDYFIFQKNTYTIGRIDSAIFLVIFVVFIIYIYRSMKSDQQAVKEEYQKAYPRHNTKNKNLILIGGGILGLIGGAQLFLIGAKELALIAGVSSLFIGLTVAALGTSLPELTVSIRAAFRGKADIAVGNIVGSYIFNILFALAIPAMIKPIKVNPTVLAQDGIFLAFLTVLFLLFATESKKITRKEGFLLVGLYLMYFGFLVWRL